MANVVKHTLRINLDNEQHMRVHKVLRSLDTGIHKSLNQFIIKAVDCYIQSFDNTDNELIEERDHKLSSPEYVTKQELIKVRDEIRGEVKDEIIKAFGSALLGGQLVTSQMNKQGTKKEQPEQFDIETEDDSTIADLVSKWG